MRRFKINPEYLDSCMIQFYELNGDMTTRYGTMSSVDHPAFASLRDHLEHRHIIETARNCSNGDRTLETFMLNDYVFKEGERFPCASALGVKFKCAEKRKKEPLDDKLFEVI